MMRFKNICGVIAVTIMLTACNQTDSKEEQATPTPNPVMIDREKTTEGPEAISQAPDSTPQVLNLPESGYEFTLTNEEKVIYENIKAQLSTDVLEGVDPISVAKVFIQCGIDGEWEAEYAMFSPDTITMSKEEYEDMNDYDVKTYDISSRKVIADWRFPLMDEGEFVLESEEIGRLDFYMIPASTGKDELDAMSQEEYDEFMEGYLSTFYLIKNDKGIWEVRYNPLA